MPTLLKEKEIELWIQIRAAIYMQPNIAMTNQATTLAK